MPDAWRIEQNDQGSWDLFNGRRPVAYDEASDEDAMALARTRGASQVTVVDSMGYPELRQIR
jgi:hypothetical protein